MARITVEDCLTKETNRFALVLLAAKRTKQLLQGSKMLLDEERTNKAVVTSLREIASGRVRFMTAEEVERVAQLQRERQAEAAAAQAAAAAQSAANGGHAVFGAEAATAGPSGDSSNGHTDSNGASSNGGSEPPTQ